MRSVITVPCSQRRLERVRAQRLAAHRAVHVGDPEEDELLAHRPPARRRPDERCRLIARSTSLDRRREPLDHLGELRVGARVGGREERLVAGEAVGLRVGGRHEQPVLERGVVDERRGVELDGQERRAVARVDELDAEEEPAAADLSTISEPCERGRELVAQARPPFANPLHQPALDELVEHREPDGRGSGAPSHVCPRSNSREPRSIAS